MKDVCGARIAEYVIQAELAARSTELAYRATHRVLPRCARVAILNPAFVGNGRAEVHLMREAYILETLHHSGVPRVFECGELDDRPWIATEYVDGASIAEPVARRPLPISDVLAIVRDAAQVLAHAHSRGVVHRNLSARAIARAPARGFPICITEWGEASIAEAGDAAGEGHADVFALGAIMLEATTRESPGPVRKLPGVPGAVSRLLEAMVSPDPDDRPTAPGVCAEAGRLADVFADGDAAIEEVEVELVDISQCPAQVSRLGWMPRDLRASFRGDTLPRRRRAP